MSPVSALAAFNNSGTQATAATTSIASDDVMSAFWGVNDTQRFLLYGSSINEIPTTGGSGAQFGGNHIFTVNNDLDCLGDLYFTVKMMVGSCGVIVGSGSSAVAITADGSTTSYLNNFQVGRFKAFGLARVINRIEFMVGTQVWQSMENHDLLNLLNVESYESSYTNTGFSTSGGDSMDTGSGGVGGGTCTSWAGANAILNNTEYHASFKLPLLSKTVQPNLEKFVSQTEDGYLMAAAPHQTVKIRVTYAKTKDEVLTMTTQTPRAEDTATAALQGGSNVSAGHGAPTTTSAGANLLDVTISGLNITLSTQMFGKHQVMCNAERQQLRNMAQGLPKRIKMTQNATYQADIAANQSYTVDLDHFSLFASALVINVEGLDKTARRYYKGDPESALNPQRYISYYVGAGNAVSSVYAAGPWLERFGTVTQAELILNSSSISGVLPGYLLSSSTADSMGLFSNTFWTGKGFTTPGSGYHIFPLASHAYDASAVPLNRFDNIRLRLATSTGGASATTTVTCIGETTALYKGGAASLAMY